MSAFPPLKRISILERRAQDDRAFFSRHWRQVHGGMVARLPYLAAYNQNHVVEDFPHTQAGFPGDGFVEQLWRSTAEMQRGYSSPVVGELVADEVNYLGHGSNYAVLASAPLQIAEAGEKLLLAIRHAGAIDLVDSLEALAREHGAVIRDDVVATIAKPNMLPALPHPVDAFLHVHCASADAASAAGRALTEGLPRLLSNAAVGVWRVRTATIVG